MNADKVKAALRRVLVETWNASAEYYRMQDNDKAIDDLLCQNDEVNSAVDDLMKEIGIEGLL